MDSFWRTAEKWSCCRLQFAPIRVRARLCRIPRSSDRIADPRLRRGDSGSYLDLAQAIQTHGDPASIADDLAQLYRRAVFSILIGNRDDHLRNLGFLRTRDGWRLAPAFDLDPNPDKHEHALAIDADDPSPLVRYLHAPHPLYRLAAREATGIEREVRKAITRCPTVADDLNLGCTARQHLGTVIDATRE